MHARDEWSANPTRKSSRVSHLDSLDVCGVDEVGRGPLAGPVVAAAVVLPAGFFADGLADSKALTPRRRESLRTEIERAGSWIGRGWVWPAEIDRINIHRASLLAMTRSVEDLRRKHPEALGAVREVLVDGKYCPAGISIPVRAIPGGDHLVSEIMAASIIAKTTRDAWMVDYAAEDPRYGFEKHKGYPTAAHKQAILTHGPCPIHRRTFRGV